MVKRLGTGTVHAVVATESKQDQRRARAHAKKMEWQSNHATGHATGRGRDVRPSLVKAMVKRAHGIMHGQRYTAGKLVMGGGHNGLGSEDQGFNGKPAAAAAATATATIASAAATAILVLVPLRFRPAHPSAQH